MVKKILILVLAIAFKINAQVNLVPNPSFESYTACPNDVSQINFSLKWFSPSTGTPDYFNACAGPTTNVSIPNTMYGNSFSRSGSAMSGIYIAGGVFGSSAKKYREYLAVHLSETLLAGQKYYVRYQVKLADSSHYASDSFGVLFRNDSISKNSNDTINAVPQISNTSNTYITSKTSWAKLGGSFIATGGERFFYLGNFHPDVTNDTLYIGPGTLTWWANFNFPYYFVDDICVSTDSLYCENYVGLNENEIESIKIYPNPTSNFIKILNADTGWLFLVYDLCGRVVIAPDESDLIDVSFLQQGAYLFKGTHPVKKPITYILIKT